MTRTARTRMVRRLRAATQKPGDVFTEKTVLIDHVVASGATTNGSVGVFIKLGNDIIQSAYLDTLTAPAAGQIVRVRFTNGSPLILGRVTGFPSF